MVKKMNKDTLKMLKESQRYFVGSNLVKEEFDPDMGVGVGDDVPDASISTSDVPANTQTDEVKDFSAAISDVLECEEEDLDEVFGTLADSLEEALGNGETKIIVNIQDVLDLLNGYIEE
jgi:hypothetical protein